MPAPETLAVFLVAAVAIGISPGPSNLYVMSRTIAQGRRGGTVAALGLAAGSLVHVLAAALGLSAVFFAAPVAYTAVRIAGAAYLIWLGLQLLREPGGALRAGRAPPPRPHLAVFRESALVEVTNPKTALFFLAFLPQFVDPGAGPVASQLAVLGAVTTLVALPCDLLVVLLSDRAARLVSRSRGMRAALDRLGGTILVGLGAWIVLEERPGT